jgi:hypothetical protein
VWAGGSTFIRSKGILLSKNQAVKALRQLFETKKPEYKVPGSLVNHLDNETSRKFGTDTIAVALEHMVRMGEVTLERSGKVINGVKYSPKPKPAPAPAKRTLDLTPILVPEKVKKPRPPEPAAKKPWSPTAKEIRRLTPDLEDYLDDSQCSAVVVTRKQLQEPVDLDAKVESKVRERYITPDNLKLAIKALREQCDSDGILQANSGIDVIQDALGVARGHANNIFSTLGWLGFKVSTREGNKWRTMVEMQPDVLEITVETIIAATPLKTNRAAVASRSQKPEVKAKPEPPVVVVEQTEEVQSPDDIVQRMVEIIEDLENQCSAKDQQITDLRAENERLVAANSKLTGKLNDKTLISSKVVSVLQRHPSGRNKAES